MVKILSSIEHRNRGGLRVWAPFSLQNTFVVRSSRYQKLPEQLLQLSVLKLDGSSFCVEVARNATVAELKRAIEEVFEFSCEGEGKILWSLVWSHFCLCYEGAQKLTSDKVCIRSLGIKDGDQLRFVRHMVIETNEHETAKRQSRSEIIHPEQDSVTNICKGDDENNQRSRYFEIEEEEKLEEEEAISIPEFKLAQFVKGLLTHPKLWYGKGKGGGLRESNRTSSVFQYHCVRS